MNSNLNVNVNAVQLNLLKSQLNLLPLAEPEIVYFEELLTQLATFEPIINEIIGSVRWEMSSESAMKWQELFSNIPGFDFAGNCYFLDSDSLDLLKMGVVMIAIFAPSLSYNRVASNNGYEVWLKDNGSAKFWFPTFEDAEKHPELYNFKGSWKDAYLLLIETLKKGWPLEEFPEELQKFLKKE